MFKIVNKLLDKLKKEKQLAKAVDKTTVLLDMFVKGMSHNSSNRKEPIFYLSYYYNKVAGVNLRYEESSSKEIQNDLEKEKTLKKEDVSALKHKQNFEIQYGAAEGKSICRLNSQQEGNYKGVKSINNCKSNSQVQFESSHPLSEQPVNSY